MAPMIAVQQPFETQQVMDAVLRRVQGEYLEMPGLSLTLQQAARLFGMPPDTCGLLLDVLVTTQFLHRNPRGQFTRADNY
jgi:hypothetical protein